MRKTFLVVAFGAGFLGLFLGGPSRSQSLYEAPIAPDAALVRLLWSPPSLGSVSIQFGSLVLKADLSDLSYHQLKAGRYQLNLAGKEVAAVMEAQTFYSVVVTPNLGVDLLLDPINTDPNKTTIIYYNLTSAPSSLKLAPGGQPIFADVAPGTSSWRAVNPIHVNLMAENGNVAQLGSVDLRAGTVVSVISLPDSRELNIAEASVSP